MMNTKRWIGLLASTLFLSQGFSQTAVKQPNVLFILADDLGCMDLGYTGSSFHETPHIDSLASSGMVFKQAYASCPVSSPTRAALMTGKYPVRINLTDYIPGNQSYGPHSDQQLESQPFNLHLSPDETTLAEAFRQQGYTTFMAGKWHLSEKETFFPENNGFDINIGGNETGHPAGGYFSPYKNTRLKDGPEGEYLTDRLTDEMIGFLKDRPAEKPFFAYLSFYTVHLPLQAKKEKIQKYERKLQEMNHEETDFVKRGGTYHKQVQNNPIYAAMVESLDENIGRLMQALRNMGLEENTIIVFTSDNGGMSTSNQKANIPTSNYPYRSGKGYLYEGGIKVPALMSWKGHIPENKSSLFPITTTDYYPTLLELCGLPRLSTQHRDGISLCPLLSGRNQTREAIFWHYPHYSGGLGGRPSAAIRMGDYKLIEFFEDHQVELYNVVQDITEQRELSTSKPELTARMRNRLHAWYHEVDARMPLKKKSVLAQNWDEGVPLGNAVVGALVWQRDMNLRLSLDRTDLWDLRPSDSLSGDHYRFAWVKEQVRKRDYLPVQKKLDFPYDRDPAPSKIPGAAIEFSLNQLGEPDSVRLDLDRAVCEVKWKGGTKLQTFVHATKPVGWFAFENLKEEHFEPLLVVPQYEKGVVEAADPVTGQDLRRLGYKQGDVIRNGNQLVYHQKGFRGFFYDVVVCWERKGTMLFGSWSVSSSLSKERASREVRAALKRGWDKDYTTHLAFWNDYWGASSVSLPDGTLQEQYEQEMYKWGSATREHSYPVSLQAVWTADNGKLPPWKGDYHHDLNTQLSYWPTYTGNHLAEGLGYLNTLWSQRGVYKRYTKQYFETDGLNVPGVCTLTGEPMGGWSQYSMSQTVGAWISQHFYLHWKYSGDRNFLRNRAYPFLKEVATFMEQISQVDTTGMRTLEISSSPETNDNRLEAWFESVTNYDLALMHFLFKATAELATELKYTKEAVHWLALKDQLPALDIDEEGALTVAKGTPYRKSHRHLSHAMAIHPLGLIDWYHGEEAQRIIRATLKQLKTCGSNYWTGYSYAWFANMKARALDGEGAAEELRTFAQCFCLDNSFHVNGDQTKSGKSRFTYRPFTLEGNFAFASGIQEMLLQSHTGIVRVLPAIPASWQDVSFKNLRTMGAFLVSVEKKDGKLLKVRVYAEKGGILSIALPGETHIRTYKTKVGEWVDVI